MIKLKIMNKQIAAILCAYNEEASIKSIIKDISCIQIFDEIILINDGSEDSTGEIIISMKEKVDLIDIHFSKNMGKGYAMAKGVEISSANYLVFIDADLKNFTKDHAVQLIFPIINKRADMVLGQPSETLINHDANPFKAFTGQRALKKGDILPIKEKMKTAGYGVETLINMHFIANRKVIKYVRLDKLIHPTKFTKTDKMKAIKEFFFEGIQILKTFVLNIKILIPSNKNKIINSINK